MTRRKSEFRQFWAALSFSFFGAEAFNFLLPIIAVISLNASPKLLGFIVAATQIPNVLSGILVGPIADRFPPRILLSVGDWLRAVILLFCAVLSAQSSLSPTSIIAVAFLMGTLAALFDISYIAAIPKIVDQSQLYKSNGRIESTYSLTQVASPLMGGLTMGFWGSYKAMLVVSVLFAVSGFLLFNIRTRDARSEIIDKSSSRRLSLKEVLQPFRFIWSNPPLRLLTITSGVFNFFSGGSAAVLSLFILKTLHIPTGLYGILAALGALGGVIAGSLSPFLIKKIQTNRIIGASLLFASIGELIVVTAPFFPKLTGAIVGISLFIPIFSITVFIVANLSLRQRLIPEDVLASVYAGMRTLTRGLQPLGAISAGYLCAFFSYSTVLIMVGFGQLIISLYCIVNRNLLTEPEHINEH